MNNFNILLVDDHLLVRNGIKRMIEHIDGFAVVAESANVTDAMEKVNKSMPDIVITDIGLNTGSGLDLVRKVKTGFPDIKLIILSMHSSEELVSEALKLGASAYLLKESAPAELEIALSAVSQGETYLSPVVSTKVIKQFVAPATAAKGPLATLTPRQFQIFRLLAHRKTVKEIAFELHLSVKTVHAHRQQIMERLNIHDAVGLVLFSVQNGLIKDEKM